MNFYSFNGPQCKLQIELSIITSNSSNKVVIIYDHYDYDNYYYDHYIYYSYDFDNYDIMIMIIMTL